MWATRADKLGMSFKSWYHLYAVIAYIAAVRGRNDAVGTSNAIREAKKRQHAQEQIDANLALVPCAKEMFGQEMIVTPLSRMDTYSTKFMDVKDQVVLAVDKIDAPEVKAGMIPTKVDISNYLIGEKEAEKVKASLEADNTEDSPQSEILYDYATTLSLNDGDLGAFKTMRAKITNDVKRYYFFETIQEDQVCSKDDFVIAYLKKTSETGIGFVFDLYDKGELSGHELIPSASAAVVLTKKSDRREDIVWEYVITMHSAENKKPKDAVIKSEYLKLQEFMRPIIVSMGILPSNL